MGCEEVVRVMRSDLFPLDTLVKEGMQDKSEYHWPALFFFAGLTTLRSVPIELLEVALESSDTLIESDSSNQRMYGNVACSSKICHPSFLQMLFEAQSHELTTKVITKNVKISVNVASPLAAFVTAWCLVNSNPESFWFIGMSHHMHVSLSVKYFEQQFKICHSQSHGRIAGLRVWGVETLESLPKLHPHTEQLETLFLAGSQSYLQDKVDRIATNLTRVFYPHLKNITIYEPRWLLPVLTRLHDLPSLTSVVLGGRDSNDPIRFSLTPQHCPFLETIFITLTASISFLDSLVLPNLNSLEQLFLSFPLTSDDIVHVCSGLKQTTSLQILGLQHTKLTLSGASMLADAIQHNKSLQQVLVADDTIGDEGVRVLHDALRSHSTVTVWDARLKRPW